MRKIILTRFQKKVIPLIAALLLAVVGTAALIYVKAGIPVASIEAENGTKTDAVAIVSDTNASGQQAIKFGLTADGQCGTVSEILVPACGAWLGAWSNDHGVSGLKNQILEHETRIGRQVQVVHSYHAAGNVTLSSDEKYFINRADTILLANWKPAATWSQADGTNATINAQIDAMADSILTVAPKKIILNVFHEPENDVSGGAPSCSSSIYVGSSGTPAEYRAMWQNVRNRFNAKGVSNVVWAINYMGFSKWDCMVKDLWPGNDLVDWVLYDPYPGGSENWTTGIGRFYNWLMANSDTTYDFKSKPFGLGEWGAWQKDQASVYKLYDDGKAALAAGTFSNIKMYTIFDAVGIDDSRVSHDDASVSDPIEQQKYNNFVTAPQFSQQN